MTAPEPKLVIPVVPRNAPKAIVIGAGLGGLSAAMRLGAKGYRVTIIDRLDRLGGRGSSVAKNGYRFDLGPTILTVPDVFRRLWTDCGRDFDADVNITPVDPYYEIRWQDGSKFQIRDSQADMDAEVRRIFPSDFAGYQRFLKDCEKRYTFGFEGLGRRPLNKLWDLVKELPGFVALRADQSVYQHAAKRVKDPRFRMALSFHPLFIGGDPRHVTSMYILVSHLEKEFGVHYVQGGVQELADAMGRVVIDQGGQIIPETTVDQILTKGNCVTGVRLETGREISADIVVSNADPGQTYDHMLRQHTKKRWNKSRLQNSKWSPNLKTADAVDWEQESAVYKEKMRKVLEQVMPGFAEKIAAEHVLTPDDFKSRYLSPYGAGFSLEPRIFQSAWFRPHNISEDFENLYLVGAGTHPGAGIPSVVTSSEVLNQLVPDAVEKV
ncbi:MAG: phytoene desaturase [Rhodobacteraceae bacterium]|nr:phytoene desaturase [Paracoccaceae bacterium]